MDLLTAFAVGATFWTAANFIPGRKPTYDDLILETWKQLGVSNKDGLLPQKKKGCWFLPAGLSPEQIKKSLPFLAYQLNADVEMEVRGKGIYLQVYPGSMPESVPYQPIPLTEYKLGLPIGRTRKQDCYIFDMNDTHPYLIVAGAPGQGKSNFLSQALRQIEDNYTPAHVMWYLIDLKLGVELSPFEGSPFTAGTCWKGPKLPKLLSGIIKEINARMELFKAAGVLKIDEYNALDTEPLPYLLIIIDEYAELRREKDCEGKLQSILQIGRATGIRCLLSTQRPSSTNLSTDIRGLIADRLTYRLPDRVNSEIVLDLPGAEELPCRGRCLLLHGAELITAQTMLAK